MQAPPLPDDEHQRLRALARYAILDTPPEESFDELTALAAEICGTPIALVSLVDQDRQWFKSRVGLDALETPRELAFCAHAILDDAVMEVPNALEDPRFADNPLVTGAPDIRFYAGAPLLTNDGHRIGTLCVIDRVPRQLTQSQLRALRTLGRQVIDLLELRHTASSLARELLKAEGASRSRESAVDGGAPVDASVEHRAFLAQVIHDLRTPLNAILGFSEYLCEDEPIADDERVEIAEKIGDAGRYMLGLVNDILDLAHLESGEFRFNAAPLDLGALAGATLDGLRPLAHAGGNRTRLEIVDAAAASIVGDEVRIRQVLANLLSNACKYTKDGEIRVRLSADGELWARLDVIDTGIGMNDGQRRRLFRPFSQVQEASKQSREGTGLGLQISRGLCEGMGGSIAVESAPGVGTTFSVWLPRAPYPAPKGRPIAIAKGDPRVRAELRRALSRLAPLVFFESVAEVLWSMVERRWRTVIVDPSADEANASELLQALSRLCAEGSTPLLLIDRRSAGEPIAAIPGAVRVALDEDPASLIAAIEG